MWGRPASRNAPGLPRFFPGGEGDTGSALIPTGDPSGTLRHDSNARRGRGAEYPTEGEGGEGEPSPSRNEEGDEGGPSGFAEECGWGSEQEKPKNQLPP